MGLTDRVLQSSWAATPFGIVMLLLGSHFGFEEPVRPLITFGAALIFLPVLLMSGHLAVTRTLSRAEKRRWLRELASWRAADAFGFYVRSKDRRAALGELLAQRRSNDHGVD